MSDTADAPESDIFRHDHIALYVEDLDRSEAWYRDVLGFRPVLVKEWWSRSGRFVGRGEAIIALFRRREGETWTSRGIPDRVHQAFRVSGPAYAEFKRAFAERGIPFREMDHGISRSIYFRDPDDYNLELTTYPGDGVRESVRAEG